MTLTVTHATPADGTFSASGTTNWNANHALAGSVAINEISAATGAVTIASGNNTGIVWNWANTADSTICRTIGETAAATNGTSTNGVPNQVLLKLITLAASTQSPLSVYSRAAHVFSISPTTAQILATLGSKTVPSYSFALSSANTGIFATTDPYLSLAIEGVEIVKTGRDGGVPNLSVSESGLYPSSPPGVLNLYSTATTTASLAKASANATGVVVDGRKSRGTPTAPTVITTGDDLLSFSGYGYVGINNLFQEAGKILFDSTGTISDATNGIGGIISFFTKKQGTDAAVAERFRVDSAGHLVSIAGTANTPTITAGGGTNPTIAGTDNAFTVTVGTGGLASSVEVTFGTAFANAPVSSAQSDTDILALKSTPTTTKVTIAAAVAFSAGSNIDCICMGRA